MDARVGVEIEFTGVSAQEVAALIEARWQGRCVPHSEHLWQVVGTRLGDFSVKLDTRFADKVAAAPDAVREAVSGLLRAAEGLVPLEVTAPPVAPEKLAELDALVRDLGDAGAKGTRHSALAAYAVHLNVELDDLSPAALHRWMLAFALGFAWLADVVDANRMRRLLSFAEPYAEDYVEFLCRVDYGDDLAWLIEDYVRANPTRSRALDMLPVLAHLDPERVTSALPGAPVSPRPALHYRLPDSRVGECDWSLRAEWQRWRRIAALAHDPVRLDALKQRFLEVDADSRSEAWREMSRPWLEAPPDAP